MSGIDCSREQPPNDLEIQEWLIRDYGWQFGQPLYTTVPSLPSEQIRQLCGEEITRLHQHLLETVIIRDPFDKDHNARRSFCTEHSLANFIKRKNKLKGNNLRAVSHCMWFIAKKIKDKMPDLYTQLNAIVKPAEASNPVFLGTYNGMSFEDKVKTAKDADKTIFRFLEVLSGY